MARRRTDPFQRLPEELRQDILSNLDLGELLQAQRVSHGWRHTVKGCLARRDELNMQEFTTLSGWKFSSVPRCISALLRQMPALTDVTLVGKLISGECLSLLPSTLQRLNLDLCQNVRPDYLRLVARCTELQHLALPDWEDKPPEAVIEVLAACPQLEELECHNLDQPPERYLPPGGIPSLRKLSLPEGCTLEMTDRTIRALTELTPGLTYLYAEECHQVTEAGLLQLRRFTQLEECHIYEVPTTDAVLDSLHGLPLKEFLINNSSGMSHEKVKRLILACPLTQLRFHQTEGGDTWTDDDEARQRWYTSLVEALEQQLPDTREVTLEIDDDVCEWMKEHGICKEERVHITDC